MIRFQTLGAVDLKRDGVEVRSVLSQPKRLALLAYLATGSASGFHSRDTLLGVFWPESDAERARNALRQALHYLRRSLGEAVVVSRGDREIGIDAAGLWCDAAAFERAIGESRPEEALELYGGEFLAGLFVEDSLELERWVEAQRARFRGLAVEAARTVAGREEARGDARSAAVYARRAAALAPDDEAAVRRLASILASAGERAAALRAFDEFAERLDREYGLSPSAETLALAERIRSGTPPEPGAREPDPVRGAPAADIAANRSPAEPAGRARRAATVERGSGSEPRAAPRPAGAARVGARGRTRVRRAAWLALVVAAAGLGALGLRNRLRAPLKAPEGGTPAIAVLPFVNMTGDPANEFFADGVSEEILNALSQVPGVRVVARTSSFSFKGKDVAIDSIGRALGVRHILEGSVRTAGNRVRITAQLIETASGLHVWSDTYDGELSDILAVQEEISMAIRRALGPRFAAEPVERAPETTDAEAHADVLRAFNAIRDGRPEVYPVAESYFRRAIERDPLYARAHAGLAGVVMVQAQRRTLRPDSAFAFAKATARHALSLDARTVDAHVVLGRIAADFDRDYEAAERHFQRALELNPGEERVHRHRSMLLAVLGRYEEAVAEARRAVELDPIAPNAHRHLGSVCYLARRWDCALDATAAALALAPDHALSLMRRALVLTALDRHEEALRDAGRAAELTQDQEILASAAYVSARAGRPDQAREQLLQLESLAMPSSYLRAMVLASLGESDRAFELLDRAVADREAFVTDLGVMPAFDGMRADARMDVLLRRLGLR